MRRVQWWRFGAWELVATEGIPLALRGILYDIDAFQGTGSVSRMVEISGGRVASGRPVEIHYAFIDDAGLAAHFARASRT